MHEREINRWIRWQRGKVIVGTVVLYLSVVLIPLAIIVWFITHYVSS